MKNELRSRPAAKPDAATAPRRPADLVLAVAVAAACVAVAGMLWSLKVSHTNVSMTLDTGNLRAVLARPWHIDEASPSQKLHGERLSAINAPNLGLAIDDASGDAWFDLEGGGVTLQTLDAQQGALMELLANDAEVEVFASRAPMAGTIAVAGKVKVMAGSRAGEASVSKQYEIDIPEVLEFSARSPRGVPSRLSIHSPGNWSLGRPRISALSFANEELRGAAERALTSGIKSGMVRFNDTSWSALELYEGDFLSIREAEPARIELRRQGGLIHVALNGTVGSVSVGEPELARVLAPSYLEYFYNKKSLGFFWSAVIFLWGLIWSVRRTLFR